MVRVVPLTSRELDELWVVRMNLDPLAASLAAADSAGASGPGRLSELAEIPSAEHDVDAWHQAHYDFHHAIWEASGNLVLIETLERLAAHAALRLRDGQPARSRPDLQPRPSHHRPGDRERRRRPERPASRHSTYGQPKGPGPKCLSGPPRQAEGSRGG